MPQSCDRHRIAARITHLLGLTVLDKLGLKSLEPVTVTVGATVMADNIVARRIRHLRVDLHDRLFGVGTYAAAGGDRRLHHPGAVRPKPCRRLRAETCRGRGGRLFRSHARHHGHRGRVGRCNPVARYCWGRSWQVWRSTHRRTTSRRAPSSEFLEQVAVYSDLLHRHRLPDQPGRIRLRELSTSTRSSPASSLPCLSANGLPPGSLVAPLTTPVTRKQTVWSLTLPQVAATLAATLVAHDTLGAAGQRLLDDRMLNVVLVLMLVTAILAPVLTERFVPRLVATAPRRTAPRAA